MKISVRSKIDGKDTILCEGEIETYAKIVNLYSGDEYISSFGIWKHVTDDLIVLYFPSLTAKGSNNSEWEALKE